MITTDELTTTLSAKGQVTLPETLLRRRHWRAGTKLIVEETYDGVLLRAASQFEPTRPQDVFGSARLEGPPISIEQMDVAVNDRATQSKGRGQY